MQQSPFKVVKRDQSKASRAAKVVVGSVLVAIFLAFGTAVVSALILAISEIWSTIR